MTDKKSEGGNGASAPAAAAAAGADEKGGNQLQVSKIYVKDVSFESPNAPQVFSGQWQPQLELQMHTGATKLNDTTFEVVVSATATAKKDDTTAFIAEAEQAGVFVVQGFEEEQLGPVLGIYCPQLLFPYLRETISNLTARGGFPPLELQPVNFEALYRRELERQASGDAAPAAADAPAS